MHDFNHANILFHMDGSDIGLQSCVSCHDKTCQWELKCQSTGTNGYNHLHYDKWMKI